MRTTSFRILAVGVLALVAGCSPTGGIGGSTTLPGGSTTSVPGGVAFEGEPGYLVVASSESGDLVSFCCGEFVSPNTEGSTLTPGAKGVFSGEILMPDTQTDFAVSLGTSGSVIQSLSLQSEGFGPGEGFEFVSDSVVVSPDDTGTCSGGLKILAPGPYMLDGVASDYTGQVSWVLCDQLLASMFEYS